MSRWLHYYKSNEAAGFYWRSLADICDKERDCTAAGRIEALGRKRDRMKSALSSASGPEAGHPRRAASARSQGKRLRPAY
jgi:hypothetical protein